MGFRAGVEAMQNGTPASGGIGHEALGEALDRQELEEAE